MGSSFEKLFFGILFGSSASFEKNVQKGVKR